MTPTLVDAPASTRYATREEWLVAAVDALRPLYEEVGETLPTVRVSVGWPGGRGNKSRVIGQCWAKVAADDRINQLFISPVLDDATRVLDVLIHELIHAIDDCQSGHRGRFAAIAKAVGLTGPMTATVASDVLRARLDGIAATLGAYPHAKMLNPADVPEAPLPPTPGAPTPRISSGPRKQGTRMLKVHCPDSGYTIRMTRKWIDDLGTPKCPCHDRAMVEA